MENTLLNSLLSLIFLLSISSIGYIFSSKIKFPYTITLVIIGMLLVPLIHYGHLEFIKNFRLTPDMLFYIFLPILIFESAYNINYKDFLKSSKSIFSLSIIGLIISVIIIASGMYFVLPFFGFEIPFIVCLLYGSLISATDTVAVLSMFKSIGAPKRLITIFEGESLFNDGTSLAIFLVILGIIIEGGKIDFTTFSHGLSTFLSMFIGGVVFGLLTGFIFSRVISKIKNNESIEITLTMILAHLTFILSHLIGENLIINGFTFHISGVIATTIAAIVMGNYGRYKISPKISEYMEKFWSLMAFIANTLVFILLGLIVYNIKIDYLSGIFFVLISVFILGIFSRFIGVIIPIGFLNFLKLEKKIPFNWQLILSWGSPRGAISFMMILMIPDNLTIPGWNFPFSIKDFLTIITVSTIMLTLFIKVPTVGVLIKKLKLNKLTSLEKIEQEQSKIIMYQENIKRIKGAFDRGVITIGEFESLYNRFELHNNEAKEIIKSLIDNDKNILKRVISIYSFGMLKKSLIELLTYNEIDEKNFKHILVRIQEKMRKLENGNTSIIDFNENYHLNIFEKTALFFIKNKKSDNYVIKRSMRICIWKALKELKDMSKVDFGFDKSVYDEIISILEVEYKNLRKYNFEMNKDFINLENKLFERSIIKTSEFTITDLKKKGIMTDKVYDIFTEKLEERIYK